MAEILDGYYDPDKHYDYTYLSLGAGVQSSALLLMLEKGLFGMDKYKVDVCFFADTQGEPYWVYDQLSKLKEQSSLPIKIVTAGNLGQQYIDGAVHKKHRFSTLPIYTKDEETDHRGIVKRACTWDFKVLPQERAMRAFMGFKKGERIAGKKNVLSLMGISWDEVRRIKPNKTPWIDNAFPLGDERITRAKCEQVLKEHGWNDGEPVRRSACLYCPFRSDSAWLWLSQNEPEVFKEACEFDKAIRDQSKSGLRSKAYLHKSCTPLEKYDFTHGGQLEFNFTGCDEGHCGV